VTVDGSSVSRAEGRANVLVYFNDQSLAVFELKRCGTALTGADEEQGLQCARVLHPRPPLGVVANGDTVRMIETHSGLEWRPEAGHCELGESGRIGRSMT
jgi:hypothetical protein